MAGIIERIGALAGTEVDKAASLAHSTFRGGVAEHGHHGRALVETVVKLCRDHPNMVGIGVGILVEQLLSEERREFTLRRAVAPATDPAADGAVQDPAAPPAATPPAITPHHRPALRLDRIRPAHIAFDVFGGLLLLKIGHAFTRAFRRKREHPDGWLASAARIHLFSAALAAYYFAAALRSPKVSAWRNAAILLFGTDAIKPLLKAAAKP